MNNNEKIGFWTVLSIVIGSQIGTGIFILPISLAYTNTAGLISWVFSGIGAIFLALVFAGLSSRVTKTGGPHTYIEYAFGKTPSFFIAWLYWLISWIAIPSLPISVVSNISPIIHIDDKFIQFLLQMAILWFVVGINICGVKVAGIAEFIFTILKILPIIIVPIAGYSLVNNDNFTDFSFSQENVNMLSSAALLTMWAFTGLEAATTPAGSVENPSKNIPKAVVIGTIVVVLVYLLSSYVIMGAIPADIIANSPSPFALLAKMAFGGNWDKITAIAVVIVSIGSLNAYVLTTSQVSYGAASEGMFPKIFAKVTMHNAPIWSLVLPSLLLIPLTYYLSSAGLIEQFNMIVDIAVSNLIILYLLCTISYIIILIREKSSILSYLVPVIAGSFCLWMMGHFKITALISFFVIIISGIPVYFIKKGTIKNTN